MKVNVKIALLLIIIGVGLVMAKTSRSGAIQKAAPAPPRNVQQLKDCIAGKAGAGIEGLIVTLDTSGSDRGQLTVSYIKDGTPDQKKAQNKLMCRYITECLENSPLKARIRCRKVVNRSGGGGGDAEIADPPPGGGGCNCTP